MLDLCLDFCVVVGRGKCGGSEGRSNSLPRASPRPHVRVASRRAEPRARLSLATEPKPSEPPHLLALPRVATRGAQRRAAVCFYLNGRIPGHVCVVHVLSYTALLIIIPHEEHTMCCTLTWTFVRPGVAWRCCGTPEGWMQDRASGHVLPNQINYTDHI